VTTVPEEVEEDEMAGQPRTIAPESAPPARRVSRDTTARTEFRPQQLNANRHTARGMDALEQSMRTDGYSTPMVAAADGEIFDGSARLETSGQLYDGIDPIVVHSDGTRPVIHVRDDIPSAAHPRAKRLAIAANRVAQMNLEWDPAVLQTVIAEMSDLPQGLWTDAELQALLQSGDGGAPMDAEPQIDRAEELRQAWGVEPGQLWQLGAHSLLCGDATQPADVARVTGGESFALLVADPPYGVAYADKNAFLNACAKGNRIQKPIVADHGTPAAMFDLWRRAFAALRPHAAPGASYYVTGPQGGELLFLLLRALMEAGFPLRHMLIWAKNNLVLGRADYHYQHEPILYGWVDGTHHFYGTAGETSLWAINRPQKSDLHPTMKPVELWVRALGNSTQPGAVVVDPFCGSGTSLIAAEQLGRRCRAMEIDPGYVAVSLERFREATGITPERSATGRTGS